MALSQRLVQRSQALGVRAGTTLQDALEKVKRASKQNEHALDIAIGELWVLAGDVFKERNFLKTELHKANNKIVVLEDEIRHLKQGNQDATDTS